jgi:GT2 family glycosyltransferase
MTLEKVLVLLVDYNSSELVPTVLKNINEDKVDVTVLLIDNGSTIESYNRLKEIKDPRVHLVRLEENIGIGGGNNYGLSYARKHFSDINYVFLLNTDAYCCPDILYGLKKILDANPDAACISPNIILKNNKSWYGGSMIDYKKGIVSSNITIDPANKREFYEVDVFNGCAVLFDFKKMLQGGLLNEDLFMYFEEAHLSMKLHKLGYKILYTPNYIVIHDLSFTTRKVSYLKTYYMARNKFITFKDTMTLGAKMYYLTFEFLRHLKNRRFKNARYLLKGYFDYKRGRVGKLQ